MLLVFKIIRILTKSNFIDDYTNILSGILPERDLVIFIEYKGLTNQRCNELPQILKRKDEAGRPIVGSIAFDQNFLFA